MDAFTTIAVTYGLLALALAWVLGKGWMQYRAARRALGDVETPKSTAHGPQA